jgi:hypothetical protein
MDEVVITNLNRGLLRFGNYTQENPLPLIQVKLVEKDFANQPESEGY